jgi:ubiquinone/menaquinone biosynthesis C-methylase UbiE
MKTSDRVKWIWSSKDQLELAARYDRWAAEYDADLGEAFGWIGPAKAAELFARLVPADARVLDAGAGTGLVGQALASHGYKKLIAADISEGMLNEARKKGVYRSFHRVVMGEPIDFRSNSFDAVISIGVLTEGHAPPGALDELVRITKPGGHVVFSLRTDLYETGGFRQMQQRLIDAGRWTLAEVSDRFRPMPKGEPEIYHNVWAYLVSG